VTRPPANWFSDDYLFKSPQGRSGYYVLADGALSAPGLNAARGYHHRWTWNRAIGQRFSGQVMVAENPSTGGVIPIRFILRSADEKFCTHSKLGGNAPCKALGKREISTVTADAMRRDAPGTGQIHRR